MVPKNSNSLTKLTKPIVFCGVFNMKEGNINLQMWWSARTRKEKNWGLIPGCCLEWWGWEETKSIAVCWECRKVNCWINHLFGGVFSSQFKVRSCLSFLPSGNQTWLANPQTQYRLQLESHLKMAKNGPFSIAIFGGSRYEAEGRTARDWALDRWRWALSFFRFHGADREDFSIEDPIVFCKGML